MPFTGKATFSAGSTFPEIAEDVSDLIAISSPFETPLLDALGDPPRAARSTVHEWLEDELFPNTDVVSDVTDATHLVMTNIDRFRIGDLLRIAGESELMLVTAIDTSTSTLTVVRGYGATATITVTADMILYVVGNAALEGDDAGTPRFTVRSRKTNYTQIFSVALEISGSELAVRQLGVRDELDYQKAQRTRELLRDLENCVINGIAPAADPQGSATVRRTMRGIIQSISTNQFEPGSGGFPADTTLTEPQLNLALRNIWQTSNGQIDLIVVGGPEKRAINNFIGSSRRFDANSETYKNQVSIYESDFGTCRIVLARSLPAGMVLMLDSSRIDVLPLAGRSFQYKPLASTGDKESGQLIGEYTLEFRNEGAHGVIKGLG